MFYKPHLIDLIERTLKEYSLYSEEAVTLVYGTISHESERGTYLRQRVKKYRLRFHALGIAQMEYNTFIWLAGKYGEKYNFLKDIDSFKRLEYDLKFAILLCRLRYRAVPSPLPKDIKGMSEYYKKYYNSTAGDATPQDFIDAVNN